MWLTKGSLGGQQAEIVIWTTSRAESRDEARNETGVDLEDVEVKLKLWLILAVRC